MATIQQKLSFDRGQATQNGSALNLIRLLSEQLNSEGVNYCHWKSNNHISRSELGENDLDLLIDKKDTQVFLRIITNLGFVQTFASPETRMPGVQDYYGYDSKSKKIIHIHAHYQLVLGHDYSKNYRLPLEKEYLSSAAQGKHFKVPSINFEYIIFVLRMMIKHSTWDAILAGSNELNTSESNELWEFHKHVDRVGIRYILQNQIPMIDHALFICCEKAISPNSSILFQLKTGEKLLKTLKPFARNRRGKEIFLKYFRWIKLGLSSKISLDNSKHQFANGGLLVAIVGGDGSGKTTIVRELMNYFKQDFYARSFHLGKPKWSKTTIVIRGLIKIGRIFRLYPFMRAPILYSSDSVHQKFPGYPWMIRELCTARDRLSAYIKAQKHATNGGIVICDRYPLQHIKLMDGPLIERLSANHPINSMISWAIKKENSFYQPILKPDVLIILNAHPKISVSRKTDEDPKSVYARNMEIWQTDWSTTNAFKVSAENHVEVVLDEIIEVIWNNL